MSGVEPITILAHGVVNISWVFYAYTLGLWGGNHKYEWFRADGLNISAGLGTTWLII